MKFKSKLKVALDMCINDKWKFRAALITTVSFLCIVMQIIYMTSTSGIYKSRVNMALSKDVEGLLYVEFKSDDVNGKEIIESIPEIENYGNVYFAGMNSTPALKQLREIQEGHQTYYSRKEYEEYEGVETVVMSKGMWDVMNLKLTEGKKPSEYDTLGNDTLIYLSEVYRGKISCGDTFEQQNIKGETVRRYVVAGFLNKKSAIMDSMIYSTGNSEKKGSYSLKYGIVEVVPTVNSDGMYVYCEPKDCEAVSDKIETAAALNDDIVRVIKISSVINYMDRESKKSTKGLFEVAVVFVLFMVVSLSFNQTCSCIRQSGTYGIWMANGLDKKDVNTIIFLKNLYSAVISVILASVLMMVLWHKFYCTNMINHMIINEVFTKKVLAPAVLISLAVSVISSAAPVIIFNKKQTVDYLRGGIL
ncbi:MAG TPA: hypothetical protein DCX93_06965 [Butyrivibrio sp.]|nr:hypothetical protein [Butyrivibrio sp.]